MDERDLELYGKHADELMHFASTLVGPSAAHDVVVTAVVRAMHAAAWSTVSEPRAYLFRCVLNEARSMRRSERRRLHREQLVAHSAEGDASGDSSSAAGQISLEVRDAMSKLSLRERSALYLAYWHDASVDEIASTLGISRRTAERALTTGRRRLEEGLA